MSLNKKKLSFVVVFLVLLLVFPFVFAGYEWSNPRYTSSNLGSGVFGFYGQPEEQCIMGQDFIVQVAPFGCSPAVVRSDLLEEQDVPVFCQLVATKINPLIDVDSIESMEFTGSWPEEVRDVGFMPNRDALRNDVGKLNTPFLENIGYTVIILKQQKNESSMPDYVEGKINTKLIYNIKNAFGIGEQSFYLPDTSDEVWNKDYLKYAFWDGKGYIRAQDVGSDGAMITIYNDVRKIQTLNLEVGKESSKFYMPGFDCLAGLTVKLDGLDYPDTRARISVNGNVLELRDEETFLDGKCKIIDINKKGLVERVSGWCKTDDSGKKNFVLSITPKVNITICDEDGKSNCYNSEYELGDVLYQDIVDGNRRNVFLGFIGERNIDGTYFIFPAISTAKTKQDFLNSFSDSGVIKYYGDLVSKESSSTSDFGNFLTHLELYEFGTIIRLINAIFSGSDFGEWVGEGQTKSAHFISQDILGLGPSVVKLISLKKDWNAQPYSQKQITFHGFIGSNDLEFDSSDSDLQKAETFYLKSIIDYETVLESFPETKYNQPTSPEIKTKGEQALLAKIYLSRDLSQKKSMMEYCEEFKEKYPESEYIKILYNNGKGECDNIKKISSSAINSGTFMVGGELRELALEEIDEPEIEEYAAFVTINDKEYIFRKNDEKYLNIDSNIVTYEFSYSSSRDKDDIKEAMKNAPDPTDSNKKLFSEDSPCFNDKILDPVIDISKKYKIDPLLMLALIRQESNCQVGAASADGAVGLMQIYSWENCKNRISGISSKYDLAGSENIEKNIECGAIILTDGYSDQEMIYKCDPYTFKTSKCAPVNSVEPSVDTKYKEWARALRMYNGDACAGVKASGEERCADQGFVEEVLAKYASLGGKLTDTGVNKQIVAGKPDFIKLKSLENDYAVFDVSGVDHSDMAVKADYDKSNLKISVGGLATVGKAQYNVRVTKINLKKFAKVSVKPWIDYAGTDTNISFKIGIEKRGISLSPDKIREKINTLNSSIVDWEDKSSKLGNVVKGLKGACLGVNAYLIVKNFLANTKGKSIARTEIMRGEGGWYDKCAAKVRSGESSSVENCLSENAKAIDSDVDTYYKAMQDQNERIKQIQEKYEKEGILGDKTIDSDKFGPDYVSEVKRNLAQNIANKLDGDKDGNITIGNEEITISKFVNDLSYNTTTIEELRELELHASVSGSSEFNEMINKKLETNIKTIQVNTRNIIQRNEWKVKSGFPEEHVYSFDTKAHEIAYSKDVRFSEVSSRYTGAGINETELVQNFKDALTGQEYILILDDNSIVKKTYKVTGQDSSGKLILEEHTKGNGENKNNPLDLVFKKYDRGAYENTYSNSLGESGPILKYYDTEPYKGLPAIVPFDLDEGWYASIKQTLPIAGSIASYSESGRVESFYLCNVGANKMEENRGGDDICQMINTGTGMAYNQFAGLPTTEADKLIDDAVEAIRDASKQYGSKSVQISTSRGTFNVKVGDPAVDIPDMQCEDFMSPSDCKLLFNVCDPVICPSSRCDLGGAYPVRDVIQSGIFGSVALCLPNFPQVYVPVCLSGVKAGIDGWLSVQKSYRDCLQQNLDTGETVGICDELHSVYLCEFFWRQGIPLAKLLIPKLLEISAGQSSRGGGEYLGVQSAWSNAEKSVDYFTQYYAANSHAAFQARSLDEAGSEVCKVSVSAVFPGGDALIDVMTQPDSPAQFYGRFDEIEYSTATNPPISQYKVYYHIYAGEDLGAYYKVYLKGSESSTYYQDTGSLRVVGSGYVEAGGYATDTVDFTAPSGYKEMCIMVNEQEECGFKMVSTDFAVNYLEDKYLQEQASKEDITSETECVAGSNSLYSFINPNVEAGTSEYINPALYSHGIIRICATKNPGLSTDGLANMNGSRWVDVGYCDDPNMRCWLDTDSVEDAIKNANIESSVLADQYEQFYERTVLSGDYLDEDGFANELYKLNFTSVESTPEDILQKIEKITDLLDIVFFTNHKGHLYFLRGEEYGKLANLYYKIWDDRRKIEEVTTQPKTETPVPCTQNSDCPAGYRCEDNICVEMQTILDEKKAELEIWGVDTEGLSDEEISDMHEEVFGSRGLFAPPPGVIVIDYGGVKYMYSDDAWYFYKDSINRVGNINEVSAYINSINTYTEQTFMPVDITGVALPIFTYELNQLSDKEVDEMLELVNKDYTQGLKVILDRAIKNKKGLEIYEGTTNEKKLEMNENGEFRFDYMFSNSGDDRYLYLRFDSSKEEWQFRVSGDKYYWPIVDPAESLALVWDTPDGIDYPAQRMFERVIAPGTLVSIVREDLYYGAKIIFRFDPDLELHLVGSPFDYVIAVADVTELIEKYGPSIKYSGADSVKSFIDGIYQKRVLTKEEYDDIRGAGLFDTEETLEYVYNLIRYKEYYFSMPRDKPLLSLQKTAFEWVHPDDFESVIVYAKDLNGDYSNNEEFVDYICVAGFMDKDQCIEVKGTGGSWFGSDLFNLEEDMDEVVKYLEENYKEYVGGEVQESGTAKLLNHEITINGVDLGFNYYAGNDEWFYYFDSVSYSALKYQSAFSDSAFRNNVINTFGQDNYQRVFQLVKGLAESSGYEEGKELLEDSGALLKDSIIVLGVHDKKECLEAFNRLNDIRESYGRIRLEWDERAYNLAIAKSKDMFDRKYYDHVTPDGKCFPVDYKYSYGFSGSEFLAENIDGHTYFPHNGTIIEGGCDFALDRFLDSRGHRYNLLYINHTSGAIGCFNIYCTFYGVNERGFGDECATAQEGREYWENAPKRLDEV